MPRRNKSGRHQDQENSTLQDSPVPIDTIRIKWKPAPKERSAILLPGEDSQRLNQINIAFYEYFRPQSIVESTLIDQMISAAWRFNRTISYESTLITRKAEEIYSKLNAVYDSVGSTRLFCESWFDLAQDKSTNNVINRYIAGCRGVFRGALADLEKVRKLKGDPESTFVPPPVINAACVDWLPMEQEHEPISDRPLRDDEPEVAFDIPLPPEPVRAPEPEPPPQPEPESPVARDINDNPIFVPEHWRKPNARVHPQTPIAPIVIPEEFRELFPELFAALSPKPKK